LRNCGELYDATSEGRTGVVLASVGRSPFMGRGGAGRPRTYVGRVSYSARTSKFGRRDGVVRKKKRGRISRKDSQCRRSYSNGGIDLTMIQKTLNRERICSVRCPDRRLKSTTEGLLRGRRALGKGGSNDSCTSAWWGWGGKKNGYVPKEGSTSIANGGRGSKLPILRRFIQLSPPKRILLQRG